MLVHYALHARQRALAAHRLRSQRLQSRPGQRRGEVQVRLRVQARRQVSADAAHGGVARLQKVERGHLRDGLPLAFQQQVQRDAVTAQVGHVQQRRHDVARPPVQHQHFVHLLRGVAGGAVAAAAAQRVEQAQKGFWRGVSEGGEGVGSGHEPFCFCLTANAMSLVRRDRRAAVTCFDVCYNATASEE